MLLIAKSIGELSYMGLSHVYAQSIKLDADRYYANFDRSEALICAEQDLYGYLSDSFYSQDGAYCTVWEENGEYVSILRMEPIEDGFLLTALETSPECRNKGYATRLLTETLSYAKRSGASKIYSHVAMDHAASMRVHLACGFEILHCYANFLDGSRSCDSYTLMCQL